MRSIISFGGTVAVLFVSSIALAQNSPAPPQAVPAPIVPANQTDNWRTSKLLGLSVYNMQNEKVGDINEILVQPEGKVTGFVVGVGGFLGMGEHDVLLKPEQIKFVNEPARTAVAPVPPNTTAPAPTRLGRDPDERWFPDHAVVNGTTDQLKAMPQFKYK